jgi:hypothetical protein
MNDWILPPMIPRQTNHLCRFTKPVVNGGVSLKIDRDERPSGRQGPGIVGF